MNRGVAALALVALVTGTARAEPSAAPSSKRRAAAVGLSLVPVNGSGHFILREKRTASRLLLLQGIGVGVAVLAGVPLLVSGASRKLTLPALPLAIAGGNAAMLGWLADIYGSTGVSRWLGAPRTPPRLALDTGYAFVDDPQFRYRSFAVVGARARYRNLELRPRAWISTATDNQRWSTEAAYRRELDDGSALEAGIGGNLHHYGDDGFTVAGMEAFASGRLHLSRIGPSLRGAFADLMVGVGTERIDYEGLPADWNGNLLGRMAFGVYIGDRGEVAAYYDHRRDDFAGGLATARGGGFLGHFGIGGEVRLWRQLGVLWELERGAANIARLGLSYRWEQP